MSIQHASNDCEPNGQCIDAVRIVLQGTPKKVHVIIDGAPSEHATFEPHYEFLTPNGPDCPPRCAFAKAIWTLKKGW
jgi:hypothetical protein